MTPGLGVVLKVCRVGTCTVCAMVLAHSSILVRWGEGMIPTLKCLMLKMGATELKTLTL